MTKIYLSTFQVEVTIVCWWLVRDLIVYVYKVFHFQFLYHIISSIDYFKNSMKNWNLCLIKKNRIAPNKGHKYVRQTNDVIIKHRPKNENQIAYYDTEYQLISAKNKPSYCKQFYILVYLAEYYCRTSMKLEAPNQEVSFA